MTTKNTDKPLSPSALKKVQKQWNLLMKDGRIGMTPEMVAEEFGDEGLQDRFELPLNQEMHLLGPYPKCLNLHSAFLPYDQQNLTSAQIKNAFEALDASGKPPPAQLHLLNDVNVEELYIPSDDSGGSSYIALENLPNLRKITITPKLETGDYPFRNRLSSMISSSDDSGLKWLCCKDLPNLESIEINGGLVWLRVQNAPKLTTMNLAKTNKLWYLHIENAPALKKLRIDKCVKLEKVHGLDAAQLNQLAVGEAIDKLQKSKSRLDGVMYKNMTWSDVEFVLNILNRGWVEAAKRGLLGKEYEEETAGIRKMPDFKKWSFNVMKPLALTDTRGSGMTPTFEIHEKGFYGDDSENNTPLESTPWGATSAEECLQGAWSAFVNSQLSDKFNTLPKMLQKLKSLI